MPSVRYDFTPAVGDQGCHLPGNRRRSFHVFVAINKSADGFRFFSSGRNARTRLAARRREFPLSVPVCLTRGEYEQRRSEPSAYGHHTILTIPRCNTP